MGECLHGEARAYRNALGIGMEEEKMAVVIQRMVGAKYGEYWFSKVIRYRSVTELLSGGTDEARGRRREDCRRSGTFSG